MHQSVQFKITTSLLFHHLFLWLEGNEKGYIYIFDLFKRL